MPQSNYVHLEGCNVVAVTDKAMLIEYDQSEYWLPLSQVADPDNYEKGDEDVTISITEWIAEQKGIEVS